MIKDKIEVESKEIDTVGADKIKIMVWDGFETLKPLSAHSTLK